MVSCCERVRSNRFKSTDIYVLCLKNVTTLSNYNSEIHESVLITTPRPFYGPFSGTIRVSWCQKRTYGFYCAREDYRGRHTDHPAGRHSVRTNQCPAQSPPFFTGRMPFLPPNQQCQSTEGITVTEKVGTQKVHYFSPHLTSASALPGEMQKH